MKNKWIINVDEIPKSSTVQKFILNTTDINQHIKHLGNKYKTKSLSAKLSFNYQELAVNVLGALASTGSFNFKYHGGHSIIESYLSTSLTWNPLAIDSLSNDPHQSALGSNIYNNGNSSFYENLDAKKNSYADTYSYNKRTPITQTGSLKILIDSFKRSLVRSRISIIKANHKESTDLKYLWHQDESIFFNLRVNIPIQSNSNYVIQFLDNNSSDEACVSEFKLIPGKAYIYDTQQFHRPYCNMLNSVDRINIICGISPWFDYHEETNSWHSNEFYGELHPFEMFQQGHISSFINP